MKPGIPWSVKGIDDDAREAAKLAARKSGMTLGEWLNSVILEQADTPDAGEEPASAHYRPSPPQARPAAPAREDFNSKLDNIAAQLARLAGQAQDTAAGRFQEQARDDEADRQIISEIIARLDRNEQVAAQAFQAIEQRLTAIDEQPAQPPAPAFPNKPEDVPGYQALESALRNIVDHIEVSEKRNRETLKSVQDRIADVAQRAANADSERILQSAPAIAKLEDRLAEVSTRLERTEAATQHALPSLVENEVTRLNDRLDTVPSFIAGEVDRLAGRIESVPDFVAEEVGKLAGRIEAVRQISEQNAQMAQTNAVQAAQKDLRDIEGRIQGALRDTQAAMRAANNSGEVQKLRGDLDSLNQRIDDLKADSASERDVHSLRVAMEQLSARVAQGPDLRPLADMDRRLAEITRKLEQAQSQAKLEPQLNALERRVFDLDQRLAEAMLHQQDPRAVDALERQISAVADRLGQTERQLSHLATIERSINEIFESLERDRTAARNYAEDAANRAADRAAERILSAQPQPLHEPPPPPSAELVALEQGLEAVRASANAADQRNQETLEAVHETLEQIVNKLAEIEGAPPADLAPPQHHAWQDTVAAHAQAEARAYDRQHEQDRVPEVAAYEPPPTTEALPPVARAAEPAVSAPAEEPALPPQQSDQSLAGEAFKHDDFIAAARRAAQAAARQSPGPIASSIGFLGRAKAKTTKVAKGPSRFSLPFLSQEKRAASAAEPAAGAAANEGKRKRLIFAGLVLLAAVSAYGFHTLGKLPKGLLTAANDAAEPARDDKAPVIAQAKAKAKMDTRADRLASALPSVDSITTEDSQSHKSNSLGQDEILTASLPLADLEAESATDASQAGQSIPDTLGPESLRTAALGGDPQAQFIVASRYLEGKSVNQDFTAAARWFEKAAAKGLAPAQYRVGTLFERGKGVPQDMTLARVWYERAAGHGNVKAMHNVAVIYAGEQAGEPDYDKAARWFTEAGRHGLKDSQYNLAVLYERGLGVKQDMGEALYWYSLAAQQNDGDAARKTDGLLRMLAPSTVASVRDRLNTFKLKQETPEANLVAVSDPAWRENAPVTTAMTDTSAYELPVLGAVVDMSAMPLDPISEAQGLLNDLGYDIGTPDGKMGTRTANAIRLFQLQAGMKVTGEVTDELIAKLKAKKG